MTSGPSVEPTSFYEIMLAEKQERQRKARAMSAPPGPAGPSTPYGRKALDGELADLGAKVKGERNVALNNAALKLGQLVPSGELAEQEVVAELTRVARQIGLDEGEIPGTIASGLAKGKSEPRSAPPRTSRLQAAPASTDSAPAALRRVTLTPASEIAVRPVTWAWQDRLPTGTLGLLAGREGIGKSSVAYSLAADTTRGLLAGHHRTRPKGVIVAATEDSWEHTVVPRLMAAGADLTRIYRVDVVTSDGVQTSVSLPRDLVALERHVREVDVALILLDPLMSRLDGQLDTHKDAEVRLALEPLTALADRTGASVLGIIHLNKGSGTDPLTLIMGSRAFAAVARAVLFVMTDPDDAELRLVGQPKNNLGRMDLPTLTFRIVSQQVAETPEGPVITGRVQWAGESSRTLHDALESAGEGLESRTATGEAAGWLEDHLLANGGTDDSASIKEAGRKAGHSRDALLRALKRLNGNTQSTKDFPRRTFWTLPDQALQ